MDPMERARRLWLKGGLTSAGLGTVFFDSIPEDDTETVGLGVDSLVVHEEEGSF